MKKLLLLLPTLTVLLFACDSDEPKYPTPYKAIEIVTMLSNDEDGMQLELVGRNDNEGVILTTNQHLTTDIQPGRRVIIEFKAELNDTSKRPMPIQLKQIGLIPFDTIQAINIAEIATKNNPQLDIISTWRTGNFINIQTNIKYDGNNRSFSIVADKATIDNDTIECYLYNTNDKVSENYIDRHIYGSFYIGQLVNKLHTRYIKLYTNGVDDKNSFIDIATMSL